jgi:DNA-directed RNA polymerase subunit RPC12/RpoP
MKQRESYRCIRCGRSLISYASRKEKVCGLCKSKEMGGKNRRRIGAKMFGYGKAD